MAKHDAPVSRRMHALIEQVYDAALDDSLWPSLLPGIAAEFDSSSCALQLRHLESGSIDILGCTDNFRQVSLGDYEAYYAARDVWVSRARALKTTGIVASHDLISDAEFERSEIFNDWCTQLGGLFYVVGAVFPVSHGVLAALGIHRTRPEGPYGEDDKRRASLLLPHLQRALQIRHKLSGPRLGRVSAIEALDRINTAALLLARDARILQATRAADGILNQRDGLCSVSHRLTALDRRTAERLAALVQMAADTAAGRQRHTAPGGALAVVRPGRLPLTILVAPLGSEHSAASAAAIAFIEDPEQTMLSHEILRELFGLTPAEATVAVRIGDGRTIEDIAAGLKISLNTARSHLKSIYLKTGTNRQSQLTALLIRSVARSPTACVATEALPAM